MTDIGGLIERVEAATGPDHEIDKAVLAYLGFSWRGMDYWNADSTKMWSGSAFFTASIDSALGLVERVLPGWCPRFYKLTHNGGWGADLYNETSDALWRSDMPTAPLAILAALLRALSARSP